MTTTHRSEDDIFGHGTDIEANFNRAADYLQHLVNKLDSKALLKFYGLYKQATVGRCNVSKPGIFNMQGRAKWSAWNDLGEMTKEVAMETYVRTLDEIEPEWNASPSTGASKTKKPSWVSVSRPYNEDNDELDPNEKKFIDHVKEGNVDEVLALFGNALVIDNAENRSDLIHLLNEHDDTGLAAIHWAADRGHANILDLLLSHGADVNLIDGDCGQTALHYATSCAYVDCIKALLKHGADRTIGDSDGLTPLDIAFEADDDDVLKILRS